MKCAVAIIGLVLLLAVAHSAIAIEDRRLTAKERYKLYGM